MDGTEPFRVTETDVALSTDGKDVRLIFNADLRNSTQPTGRSRPRGWRQKRTT